MTPSPAIELLFKDFPVHYSKVLHAAEDLGRLDNARIVIEITHDPTDSTVEAGVWFHPHNGSEGWNITGSGLQDLHTRLLQAIHKRLAGMKVSLEMYDDLRRFYSTDLPENPVALPQERTQAEVAASLDRFYGPRNG